MGWSAGSYSTTPPVNWTAVAGGVDYDDYEVLESYWLGHITGTDWSGGRLAGTISGRDIGLDWMGRSSGDILGTYDGGNWQAVSLGTWSGTPLNFVSRFESSLTAVKRDLYANWYQGEPNNWDDVNQQEEHYAIINWLSPGKWNDLAWNPNSGIKAIIERDTTPSTEGWIQNPLTNHYYKLIDCTGTWEQCRDAAAITMGANLATINNAAENDWLVQTFGGDTYYWIGFTDKDNEGNWVWVSGETPYVPNSYSDGWMNALMGGTTSLWTATQENPATVTMIGQYPYTSNPHLFNTEICSYNYITGYNTTYEEVPGAYRGYLAGTEINNQMDGRLIALYIDPSGNAGYLRGSLTGTAYPDIEMFEMDGNIYPTQVVSSIGITPENLSIWSGWGYGSLSGTIGTDGWIKGNGGLYLNTMSIVDYWAYITQPWGIYMFTDYGEFSNPSLAATWTAKAGGDGSFGAYYDDYYGWLYDDYGYWLADAGGSLADNKITGTVNGRFITYTKMGDISGDLLGTYNTDNTWQAVSLGTWSGTPLTFVSDVYSSLTATSRYYYDSYSYPDGGSYHYEYYSDNGYVYYYRPEVENYYINYSSDGTYSGYDYMTYTSISGTWDTTQTLASLIGTPPDAANASLDYSDSYLTTYSDGWMNALMGGTTSLWTATQESPASVTMIGQYYPSSNVPHIWSTELYSKNYITGYNTTYDDPPGAYYGYIAGTDVNNSMDARLIALYIAPYEYIDPETGEVSYYYNAGYLKGNLTGTAYPDINMFEMDGGIYPTQIVSNIGITPENLYSSIWWGWGNGALSGSIGTDGWIKGNGGLYLDTMSIVDWSTYAAQPWGIYMFTDYGEFSNPSLATTWTAKVGGDGTFGAYYDGWWWYDDSGYWLADIKDGTWDGGKLAGTLSGRFITYTKMGDASATTGVLADTGITGDLLGTYNTDNTWQAVSLGTWSGTELKFMSEVYPDRYKTTYYLDYIGYLHGLMGGTESLWSGSNIPVTVLGEYYHDYYWYPDNTGNNIWYDSYNLYSYNYKDWTDTTYDDGAYKGFMGGIEMPSAVSGQRTLEGKLIALYIDPSGNAGYLRGSLTTGTAYTTDIQMFEMDGFINREQVEIASNVGVSPSDLYYYTWWGYMDASTSGSFTGGGTISGDYYDGATLSIYAEVYDDVTGEWTYIPQNWGIYLFSLYGGFDTPTSSWTAKIGGDGYFGAYYDEWYGWYGDYGYWLADITNGTWGSNKLTGTLGGRFITYTKMGDISGDLLGTYNADNTWQALSLGTWSGTPLTFVSNVSSSLTATTMYYYYGSYSYADGGSYYYDYYTDNHYGYSYYSRSGYYKYVYCNADGTYWGYENDAYISGRWDETYTSLSFLATPPADSATLSYSDSYLTSYYDGYLSAVMGGTASLWTAAETSPAPVTMIGQYYSDTSYPHIFGTEIYSYNYTTGYYTTYDDPNTPQSESGAYYGYLGGTEVNNQMDGRLIALYIDPPDTEGVSRAGILKGTLTGTAYPDISMFEMDGGVYPIQIIPNIGITPEALTDSIRYGYGYGGLSGTIGTDGWIKGNGNLYLDTMSIVDWSTYKAQPWGIYMFTDYGEFSNPNSETTWTAKAGGSGDFGAYEYYGWLNNDYGYWLADAGGSLADNKITGNVSGRFITYTKLGTIEGDLLGTYNADNTWQAVSLGTWSGEPTYFGGDWYNSNLYNDYGWISWDGYGGDNYGLFGFKQRDDGNYDFLAIGEYYDYGFGVEGYGGPYIWSGSMWAQEITEYRYLQGFTGGSWKKANPADSLGIMNGYGVGVYYTEDGKAGLLRGVLQGNFYEMYEYWGEMKGMWQVEGVLTNIDKTASLPSEYDVSLSSPYISSNSLYAYLAGGFADSTENTIFGEYYNGKTKFITYYDSYEYYYKSLPFGIYNLKMEYGSYTGKPAEDVAWSAKIGDDGYFGYNWSDKGYWLANIDGTWNEYSTGAGHGTIGGNLSGKYITYTHMGTIEGPFYGLYTEDYFDTEIGEGYGTWIGMSVGTYEGTTPLDFSGDVNGGLLYYGSGCFITGGSANGIIGGTGNLLSGVPTTVYLMGKYYKYYDMYGNELYQEPSLIYGSGWYLQGNTGINTADTTDDGAFNGYIVGVWNGGKIENAKVLTLYIDQDPSSPSNKAGYLYGDMTGDYYEGIKMWEAEGSLTATSKGDTGLSPDGVFYSLVWGGFSGTASGNFVDDTGNPVGGTISADFIEGATMGLSDQNWGIWNVGAGGTYTGTTSNNFNAKLGGNMSVEGYSGYWLGDLSSSDWGTTPNRFTASLTNGYFMTTTIMGDISTTSGGILGTFGEATWQAAGVGIYENVTELAFVGQLDSGRWYYSSLDGTLKEVDYDPYVPGSGITLSALWGGTTSLWEATQAIPAQVTLLGKSWGTPGVSPSYVTANETAAYNHINNTWTTYYGGLANGFMGGRFGSSDDRFVAYHLYVDPLNNAGIIRGSLDGTTYPEINMWEAQGSLYPVQLASNVSVDFNAQPNYDPISNPTGYITFTHYGSPIGEGSGNFIDLNGNPIDPDSETLGIQPGIIVGAGTYTSKYLTPQPEWGVWSAMTGGTYEGTTTDNWTLSINADTYGIYENINSINRVEVSGTQWSDNKLSGGIAGYWADITSTPTPTTGISVGETLGTFNPADYTWQAISMGVSLETNKFLEMAGKVGNNPNIAALQALNIPCVEVGRADLSATNQNNFSSLSMNDVIFFAPSTGQRPQIWATGNVGGTYTAPPVVNTAIPLSGSGLSADFTFKTWDSGSSKWLSTVTNGNAPSGIGSYSGPDKSFSFQGAAAGTGATAGSGSISGTGAGVAK